jgi:hypothetical protein
MALNDNYGIIPPSGQFGEDWPVHHNIPAGASGSLSTGGWTVDHIPSGNFGNEGFIQQTFLGASIRGFDLNAGFGDTTSTMSATLVNDEFNKSDGTPLGVGDDPYHNGGVDTFRPPVVGTPVFFKFGKNPSSVEQAFRQTFDDLYNVQTLPTKTNPNNAWGHDFPQSPYDPADFDQLEDYHMVDLIENVIEDRSELWDGDSRWRGRNHFVFGGILQSYTQNKGPGGLPLFSVSVSDPREILASVEVLLNNYQGTTYNNKNIINLYGFLEYDPSTATLLDFEASKVAAGVIEKFTSSAGAVSYIGMTANWSDTTGWETSQTFANVATQVQTWTSAGLQSVSNPSASVNLKDQYYFGLDDFTGTAKPEYFPITGQGFSRRSDKGMPWYRVQQGLGAMFQYYGFMPQEFTDAGFGGQINFRGYNYVVDFDGIPTGKIPLLYYMDFDKLNLLDLAMELCDIISHDLYVTLLPVIDHPASEFLFNYNENQVSNGTPENMVVGIIRLDAIDRTVQPEYGAIKSYLDTLSERGIDVENQDVGFELANVTTDKFVVGAQEVDMFAFSTERDRDDLWKREGHAGNLNVLQQTQWDVRIQEQQQLIPYYGMLGNNAVSIPRGFGSYQQILLDSTNLEAFGVGNYYVATELELRAALVSFDSWKNFLLSYNDVYIEDISEHSAFFDALSTENGQITSVVDKLKASLGVDGLDAGAAKDAIVEYFDGLKARQFAVTVPRCVWASDRPYMKDGYPASPCSPPLGYPLYYKRATRIGIVEAGVAGILNSKTRVVTDLEKLKEGFEGLHSPMLRLKETTLQQQITKLEEERTELIDGREEGYADEDDYISLMDGLEQAKKIIRNFDILRGNAGNTKNLMAFVENIGNPNNGGLARFMFNIEKTARKHNENAKKVYEFVRKIADECLGKKFLVRIPKACNLNYNVNIATFGANPHNVQNGPFGFPPRPISSIPNFSASAAFNNQVALLRGTRQIASNDLFHHYLEDYTDPAFPDNGLRLSIAANYTDGALKGNYNPFSESWEWNYKPEPQGGFYSHALYGTNNVSALEYVRGNIPFSALPKVMQQGLVPIDVKNLMSDSSRLKCYAKYNYSHILDFTGVNPEEMTQQAITEAGQFVPDIIEDLPNNNIDAETTFDSISQVRKDQRLLDKQQDSVAFVKCSIEEKLYMPPKLEGLNRTVWANEYNMRFAIPDVNIVKEVVDKCTTISRASIGRANAIFGVPEDGGSDGTTANWTDFKRVYDSNLDGMIVVTDIPELDDEHVYALITVPGRIKSTADVRWRDGPMQAYNTVKIKHLMTQDVVKIPEFGKPSLPNADLSKTQLPCGPTPIYQTKEEALVKAATYGLKGFHYRPTTKEHFDHIYGDGPDITAGFRPGDPTDWVRLTLEQVTSARRITKTVLKGFSLSQPQVELGFISPSPIFPDIVVLPLMSQERCYGPWMSASQLDSTADARVKYSNLGGKVEFVKDENLAPWSYSGYGLMDEAGALQANFSNSLLLFSERGGFVMPDAPTGIALASALKQGGPLITSIGITVDDSAGVKTTVKMDLYTSSFGKLQKQKELAVSQMGRERQRILDEKNNSIRRGLGKKQTSIDLVNTVMDGGGKFIMDKVTEITRQMSVNEKLGKLVDDFTLSLGKDGSSTVTTSEQAAEVEGSMDGSTAQSQKANTFTIPLGADSQIYSMGPDPENPNVEPDTNAWMADRMLGIYTAVKKS